MVNIEIFSLNFLIVYLKLVLKCQNLQLDIKAKYSTCDCKIINPM